MAGNTKKAYFQPDDVAFYCRGDCGRRLKSRHMPSAPNTINIRGDGMCDWCLQRTLPTRAERLSRREAIFNRIKTDLDWIIRDRRNRGVPVQGFSIEGDSSGG